MIALYCCYACHRPFWTQIRQICPKWDEETKMNAINWMSSLRTSKFLQAKKIGYAVRHRISTLLFFIDDTLFIIYKDWQAFLCIILQTSLDVIVKHRYYPYKLLWPPIVSERSPIKIVTEWYHLCSNPFIGVNPIVNKHNDI